METKTCLCNTHDKDRSNTTIEPVYHPDQDKCTQTYTHKDIEDKFKG